MEWTGLCGVLEHKESGASKEEPCGRLALREYSGYCMVHYKECLVELVNQKHLDPALLFDVPEMVAELQRWKVRFPQQQAHEADALYKERLRKVLMETVGLSSGAPGALKRVEPSSVSLSASRPPPRNPWPTPQANTAKSLAEDTQLLLLLND